jgi:hypothetical protein
MSINLYFRTTVVVDGWSDHQPSIINHRQTHHAKLAVPASSFAEIHVLCVPMFCIFVPTTFATPSNGCRVRVVPTPKLFCPLPVGRAVGERQRIGDGMMPKKKKKKKVV